jgi:hypothetical protein
MTHRLRESRGEYHLEGGSILVPPQPSHAKFWSLVMITGGPWGRPPLFCSAALDSLHQWANAHGARRLHRRRRHPPCSNDAIRGGRSTTSICAGCQRLALDPDGFVPPHKQPEQPTS